MKFTMGKGYLGFEREAYYVGWVVVGYWLEHGMSFAKIARTPEKDMAELVKKQFNYLLNQISNRKTGTNTVFQNEGLRKPCFSFFSI